MHDQRQGTRQPPKNSLSFQERQDVVRTLTSPPFADLSPKQIVPILADAGDYVASESTMYRILRAENLAAHRDKSQPKTSRQPTPLVARGPNELWSWDISYLQSMIRGEYFYLYLIVDLFSRKIVGWHVHDRECSEYAAALATQTCHAEGVESDRVVLHSDNGSPMKGATMLATLEALGVMPSFSRPSVSNDNPYSESLFRTLKYRPEYPEEPFSDLNAARAWVSDFVEWYNTVHRHSGIKFVTPAQKHRGDDIDILYHRHKVYEAAKQKHPERWSDRTRNWTPLQEVTFKSYNLANKTQKKKKEAA